MPSLRLVLPASALLVMGFCWSVDASPTERTPPRGVVTNYITPMANISLDKLVGRWYIAASKPFDWSSLSSDMPENISARLCLVVDFHYDDNGTLLEESYALLDGVRSPGVFMFPLSENGVWDKIYFGVSGEVVASSSHAIVHVDDRFLAVATCNNTSSVKDCVGYVLVRNVEDADHQSKLAEVHRQLVNAGVDGTVGFVKVIEPCRSVVTATPDLSTQTGSSSPDDE